MSSPVLIESRQYQAAPASQRRSDERLVVALLALTWMIVNTHRYTAATYLGASSLMADFGITAAAAGLMAAAYFPAYGVLQVPAGVMVDRVRPAAILRWSVGMLVFSNLLFAVAPSVEWATLARVMVGLSSAPVWLAGLKILADLSLARYPRRVGVQVTAGAVGTIFSLFLLPMLLRFWHWRELAVALTIPVAVLTLVLCRVKLPDPGTVGRHTSAELLRGLGSLMRYRTFWWLALPAIMWNGAYFGLVTWLPRYSRDVLGMPTELIGLLPLCFPVGLLIGGTLAGWTHARWHGSGPWLYYGGGALTALAIAAFPAIAATGALWALYPLTLLLGLLFGCFFCWMGMVSQLAPPAQLGAVTGYINFLTFITAFADPLIAGYILDAIDRPETANPTYSAEAFAAGMLFLSATVVGGVVVGLLCGRKGALRTG